MLNRFILPQRQLINLLLIRSYTPRNNHKLPNPGIQRQMKILKDIPEIINDPEGLGDLETDFMNVHESHKQYEIETVKYKEKIRLSIIKNKYFKIKQPNFLTYAEKEQIKLLNNRDPIEWNAEKLSESFPADPETINKLIKSKWIAKSKERILKHDENVMKNWNLYKMGKITNLINDELKQHIDKFTDRKINDLKNFNNNNNNDWEPKLSLPKPKINEFSKIITSCKKYTIKNENELSSQQNLIENQNNSNENKIINQKYDEINNSNENNLCPGENETFLMDKIYDKRHMRYEDVKRIKNLSTTSNNFQNEFEDNDEKEIQKNEINDTEKQNQLINKNNPFMKDIKKYENHEIEISKEDMKKYDVTTIKLKIHIPRKLWKKYATYKVEDCYYDDDGEFLYRVPGMTGKNVQ